MKLKIRLVPTTFGSLVAAGKIRETYIGYNANDMRYKWIVAKYFKDEQDDNYSGYYYLFYHPELKEFWWGDSPCDDDTVVFSKRQANQIAATIEGGKVMNLLARAK